jgi:hypothetical protein
MGISAGGRRTFGVAAPLVEQWFGTTLAGPPHHDLRRFTQIN